VVKGSYRFNFAIEGDDFIWKDANYLLQEGSWRYFFGERRYNTYDPAVFNSFKLSVDAPIDQKSSLYIKIAADPWSFVGKSKKTTLPTWYGTTNADDSAEVQLKYWSNSGRVYPQIVRSSKGGSFALPETKVVDGYTQTASVFSDWGSGTHRLDIPELKIDREFKPIKALWFDVKEDEYRAVFFLYAEENIAMWSDDPLLLVNNHMVWEASPWLSKWQPGNQYTVTGWESGGWASDSQLRDSESNWLTLLRAVRFEGEIASVYTDFMIAAPMDPWDDYDTINNVPMALRFKKDITRRFTLGSVYTARLGYDEGSTDAFDEAAAIDAEFDINENHTLKVESAVSSTKRNLNTKNQEENTDDFAYKAMLVTNANPFDLSVFSTLAFTRMGRDFQAPLASYVYTRDDLAWGRHISFYKRSKEEEDYRIGNSIDGDREVISWDIRFGEYEGVNTYFNIRNVRQSTDDTFIENVFRNEMSYKISDDLLTKFLFLYHERNETDEGKNQDTSTVSAAFQYKFTDWLRLEEIWERTTEYPGYPGNVYDWLTINPQPPYPYYYIVSSKMVFVPADWAEISLENTYNEFEHAATLDDFMNYSGTTMRFWLTEKFSANLIYRYSIVADYDKNYEKTGHHNLYFDFTYDIFDDASLKLQFSELGNYVQGIGWQTSVLDTQHIVRILYEGRF